MTMIQAEQQYHRSIHQQQQQEPQQQPLRQEDHGDHTGGMLAPPQSYYYFDGNNSSIDHHSDALATSSTNMYVMQQQQEQQQHHYRMSHEQQHQQEPAAHITLSESTAVPMTTNVYRDDNYNNSPRMIADNINTPAVSTGSSSERNQLPSYKEFETIVKGYLYNLSSKKRDKALIDRHRYSLIVKVLKDPKNTTNSTAQFRFWVKKMFQLIPLCGGIEVVCHDDKPVAMREEIYAILVRAHIEANHGGRDKTSALVRRRYSWIPKELIARFVRHCPFCISRRNGGSSPTISLLPRTPPDYKMCSPSIAAAVDTTVRGNSYSTQLPQTVGLPYLPMELKSGSSENDDLGITNKNNAHTLPRCDRNQHHHLQHQQQYFDSPMQPSIGTGVASPATTPISGPISVDFCVTSSTDPSNAALPSSTQEVSSCSSISPVPFGAPNTFFHQPALISQCDITSFGYSNTSADIPANRHMDHPPSYNSMCYTAGDGPENTLSMTANTPPQAQSPQLHEVLKQRNNGPSGVESYYYTASQQLQKQNETFDDDTPDNNKRSNTTKKRRRKHVNCDAVALNHTIYSLSSPSPSSSFSSSSSSSSSSMSPPISPTDSVANTTFNTVKTTSSSKYYNNQSMYMQYPTSSTTTLTTPTNSSPEALEFIDHQQQQQHRQF